MEHHHKHRLVWAITLPVFAVIVGVWAWHLQYVIARLGPDPEMAKISSAITDSALTATDGYNTLKTNFDAQAKALDATVGAAAVQAATIETFKAKVEAAAKAQDNHPVPANENVNVNTPTR